RRASSHSHADGDVQQPLLLPGRRPPAGDHEDAAARPRQRRGRSQPRGSRHGLRHAGEELRHLRRRPHPRSRGRSSPALAGPEGRQGGAGPRPHRRGHASPMSSREARRASDDRRRRDHHDWASETYVDEWVRRQQAEDLGRAGRFQLMCDLFPFPKDAPVTILDIGAGYGPVSGFILEQYPHATCVAQDASEPMLNRARPLVSKYGERLKLHRSDLFEEDWLPAQFGRFDAAVSSSCLHNLRDFNRIRQIYREIRAHLKPGGVFLNADLTNAPTTGLRRRYEGVVTARHQREGASADALGALVRQGEPRTGTAAREPFPATLDQHLAALKAAGFTDVDCFWKELRGAVVGGYAAGGGAWRSN